MSLAESLRRSGLESVDAREPRRFRQLYLTYPGIREAMTPEFRGLLADSEQATTWNALDLEAGETTRVETRVETRVKTKINTLDMIMEFLRRTACPPHISPIAVPVGAWRAVPLPDPERRHRRRSFRVGAYCHTPLQELPDAERHVRPITAVGADLRVRPPLIRGTTTGVINHAPTGRRALAVPFVGAQFIAPSEIGEELTPPVSETVDSCNTTAIPVGAPHAAPHQNATIDLVGAIHESPLRTRPVRPTRVGIVKRVAAVAANLKEVGYGG